MSRFSASDAAFSGFRLVRENLKAIAVWAVAMTVISVVHTTITIHFFGPQLEALSASMDSAANTGDAGDFARAGEGMGAVMLWLLPYTLLIGAITTTAVNRLILRPEAGKFFYLGLGMAELRQLGVAALTYLTLMGTLFVGSLLAGFLGALGGPTGMFLGVLTALGAIGATIFLAVRLSLAAPATFDQGRVTFFRSMPMTKGVFWSLFGAYLLATVMALIVFLLLSAIITGAAALISGDISVSARMMRADTTSLKAYFSPIGIAQSLFSGVLAVLINLVVLSPAPTIYRELQGGGSDAPSSGGW